MLLGARVSAFVTVSENPVVCLRDAIRYSSGVSKRPPYPNIYSACLVQGNSTSRMLSWSFNMTEKTIFILRWVLNSIHNKIVTIPGLLNSWCWGKLLHAPAANSNAWDQVLKLCFLSLALLLFLRRCPSETGCCPDWLSCLLLLPVSSDPLFSEHLNFPSLIPLGATSSGNQEVKCKGSFNQEFGNSKTARNAPGNALETPKEWVG